jgi:hypothetical protein
MRVAASIDPLAARLNSRQTLRIQVSRTDYELTCSQGPASPGCSVAPNVRFDKTDLDALSENGVSFRLGLCDNSSASCRKGVPWSPLSGETNLQKNGLTAPGTFYLSWQVGGYPDAAFSNLLTFHLGSSPSIRE